MEADEDLSIQIDAPLQVFINTLSETMEARAVAAQAVADEIYKAETAGCRLNGVREHVTDREAFLSSAMLETGEKSVGDLRRTLTGKGTFFKVTFSSSTPPDPTDKILPLIRDAGGQIKALNVTFNAACAEIHRSMTALPATDTAKMQALTVELQQRNETLSHRVKQIVDQLNQQVSMLDAPLVDWAVQSLKGAQPQDRPAAQD
jgi:hypothetical protein